MKTLVIPDIHEQWQKANFILENAPEWDRVIFLGDYFDSFDRYEITPLLDWLYNTKCKLGDKADWFWGNHDLQYAAQLYNKRKSAGKWDEIPFSCSGYSRSKANKIRNHWKDKNFFDGFKVCEWVDGWLLSHAGFTASTFGANPVIAANVKRWNEISREMLESIKANLFERGPLWEVGVSRWGSAEFGSPIWLDFREEFPHGDLQINQIVGHTNGKEPRAHYNGHVGYCIDCFLRYFCIIDDGEVQFYQVDWSDFNIAGVAEITEWDHF